eukprot:g83423.t1
MGEPEELADGVGELNLNPTPAPAGFWKPWGELEEKEPSEMKNPRLVRARARIISDMSEIGCSLGCFVLLSLGFPPNNIFQETREIWSNETSGVIWRLPGDHVGQVSFCDPKGRNWNWLSISRRPFHMVQNDV